MARPVLERNIEGKKIIHATKTMSELAAERPTDVEDGETNGIGFSPGGDVFKAEVRRAMGLEAEKKEGQVVVLNTEYSSPQLALEALEAGEFDNTQAIKVVANLGLVSDDEIEDLTPKKAVAILRQACSEDEGELEVPEDVIAPTPKKQAKVKGEPFKQGEDYPKQEEKEEKKIKKMEKKSAKVKLKKKAQAAPFVQYQQGGQPAQQPVTVKKTVEQQSISVPGDTVEMINPTTGQKQQFQVQPDGSYKVMQAPIQQSGQATMSTQSYTAVKVEAEKVEAVKDVEADKRVDIPMEVKSESYKYEISSDGNGYEVVVTHNGRVVFSTVVDSYEEAKNLAQSKIQCFKAQEFNQREHNETSITGQKVESEAVVTNPTEEGLAGVQKEVTSQSLSGSNNRVAQNTFTSSELKFLKTRAQELCQMVKEGSSEGIEQLLDLNIDNIIDDGYEAGQFERFFNNKTPDHNVRLKPGIKEVIYDQLREYCEVNPIERQAQGDDEAEEGSMEDEKPRRIKKKEEKKMKYTASKKDGRWIVQADNEAVFSVGLDEAYENASDEDKKMFDSEEYGEELVTACNLMGPAEVITNELHGNARIEAQKSKFDYESELVEALDKNDPISDDIIAEYSEKFPKEARRIVAIYNADLSVEDTSKQIKEVVNTPVEPDREAQIAQQYRSAPYNYPGQFESEAKDATNVEKPMEQEGDAVMKPEIVDEMSDKQKADKDVVEMFAQILAPIIATTDVFDVSKVIDQMKTTFSDETGIARFRGILEEKVKQAKENQKIEIEEKNPEEFKVQEQQKQQEEQQLKSTIQGKLNKVKHVIAELNTNVENYDSVINQLETKVLGLTEELNATKQTNSNLIKERTARLKFPRAQLLAQKYKEIGIETEVKDIMLYDNTKFEEECKKVEGILKKVGRQAQYVSESVEPLIGGGVPGLTEIEEETESPFSSRAPRAVK